MSVSNGTLRLLEHVHGQAGWLTVAALTHPAIILRNPRRRARLAVALSASLATLVGVLGGYLYFFYSHQLRRVIYIASARHGLLFERKEHLAFAAVAFAWAGALLHLLARGDDPSAQVRARAAHLCFVGAAALAAVVAALGTIVGSFRTF